MISIKKPAVDGFFYPADPIELKQSVQSFLAGSLDPAQQSWSAPKAIIAPHAGYIYSGQIAGSIYRFIQPIQAQIKNVILLGPAHRVGFKGIAGIQVDCFATPLGNIPVNQALMSQALSLSHVQALDIPYKQEHCIEVQLPFLQEILSDFSMVPFLVSQASADQVAELIDLLWGDQATLIVISSDLSHYYDYETANQLDQKTTEAILALRPELIDHKQACGRLPIQGLLQVAKMKNLTARLVDVKNSGDTAGDKSRVVGYGAYYFGEA